MPDTLVFSARLALPVSASISTAVTSAGAFHDSTAPWPSAGGRRAPDVRDRESGCRPLSHQSTAPFRVLDSRMYSGQRWSDSARVQAPSGTGRIEGVRRY